MLAKLESGEFKGRKMIVPNEVMVSRGKFIGGQEEFAKFCLKHDQFISDNGCDKCKKK